MDDSTTEEAGLEGSEEEAAPEEAGLEDSTTEEEAGLEGSKEEEGR